MSLLTAIGKARSANPWPRWCHTQPKRAGRELQGHIDTGACDKLTESARTDESEGQVADDDRDGNELRLANAAKAFAADDEQCSNDTWEDLAEAAIDFALGEVGSDEEKALVATKTTADRAGMKVAGQSHEEAVRTIHEALTGAFLAGMRVRRPTP